MMMLVSFRAGQIFSVLAVRPDGAHCVSWPPSGLKLFLRAGPGPSDTANTTEKPWEASSPRSETSTWFIISGVRCKMTKCAARRMITPGRLQFSFSDSQDNIFLCAFEKTRLARTVDHLVPSIRVFRQLDGD